jgi:hypothetical protein
MISGVQVTVDADVLIAIADTARKSPKLMATAYDRATRRLRKRLIDDLSVEPPKPTYPLRWKSDKQRRYVMAKLRAENNLPYQRTGALIKAWKVVLTPDADGSIMTVSNNAPAARYVVGDDQQPFHIDTGWPSAARVIADYRVEAENVLIDTWFTVSDPTAGV